MKSFTSILKSAVLLFVLLPALNIFAQMHDGDGVRDSINVITITGTAIVIDTTNHPMYFLDEDGDGNADYHLNFGPFWYQPDSSNAVRPLDGETITIEGGEHQNMNYDFPTVIVFKINGEFWRRPFRGFWHWFMHHGRGGHGFGWNRDSLETLSVSGTALVDTTYFMTRYYLDVDNDAQPDYFLNFGPPWYQPESGAVRPLDGEQINITGGNFVSDTQMSMLLVYEINGLVWRDSTRFGRNFGGGWMHRNMNGSIDFNTPFDDADVFSVNQGWSDGGMGGGMMFPDSIFCEFSEIFPEEIPGSMDANVFAGYQINLLKPNGESMMGEGMGGSVSLSSSADFQLHFSDEQLSMYGVDKSTVNVKMWDEQSNAWVVIPANLDEQNNLVSFSSPEVSNYIILTAENITAVGLGDETLPSSFTLNQNYPNPFNPSTQISFALNSDSQITLDIFNILGQKVATLINEFRNAGTYSVNFDASNLTSGIYFYRLSNGQNTLVKKMNLIK